MIPISCLVPDLPRRWRWGAPRGLATLRTERLRIAARSGANATAKILALIADMIPGADSIDDLYPCLCRGPRQTGLRRPSQTGQDGSFSYPARNDPRMPA